MSEPRTHQDQDPKFVHQVFSSIASRYVMTNHCLSLGIDVFWRKKVGRLVAEIDPEVVLDVATGSGDLAQTVQGYVPEAQVIGTDFCAPMLAEARKRGLQDLFVADGMDLPLEENSVDALTIGYGLRNMADWSAALAEFVRVVRPGGRVVILDFSLPENRLLRAPYRFYLHRVLPKVAGWLTGNRDAYAYLGESIERFPSGDAMLERMGDAGLIETSWFPQLGGVSSVYCGQIPG